MRITTRRQRRRRIHARIRKKITGTAARPRLAVYRSLKHIYAQVIDDAAGTTLVAAGSRETGMESGGNAKGAALVGEKLAERARAAGIETVVFDRGGSRYHGRIKALADAVRNGGVQC